LRDRAPIRFAVSMRLRVASAAVLLAVAVAAVVSIALGSAPGHESGSTLRTTFADPNGSGVLRPTRGEQLVDRTALAPRAIVLGQLALFAQITDVHITDEESPARLEMLDRLGAPFTSAFRPQEALTSQVLAATVATIDRLRPQAVVITGDLIDNAQQNELNQALAVLHGGRVDPNSGGPGYQGVQAASNPDAYYYRPQVDPPRQPGLLAEAQLPFVSPGLHAPWYPVVGNHDLLVQGNLPPSTATQSIATGSRKLVALSATALQTATRRSFAQSTIDALLARGLPGRSIRVRPDTRRRELTPLELLTRLRRASGHGGSGPLLDYAFRIAPHARGIVLDVIRRTGGAAGLVRPAQVAWLRRQLAAAGSDWVFVFSHTPLASTAGGTAVLTALDSDPHVVAVINGDTHRNSIVPRRTRGSGYWLIGTSSLIDYPQQARAFRLLQTAGGGIVLQTWMLNADPANRLASISRQLAYLDFQGGRVQGYAGTRADRNASLYLRPRG
jgi:metallophosphoesterase (TIGR03767 family)